jgi:hypothetical protein
MKAKGLANRGIKEQTEPGMPWSEDKGLREFLRPLSELDFVAQGRRTGRANHRANDLAAP